MELFTIDNIDGDSLKKLLSRFISYSEWGLPWENDNKNWKKLTAEKLGMKEETEKKNSRKRLVENGKERNKMIFVKWIRVLILFISLFQIYYFQHNYSTIFNKTYSTIFNKCRFSCMYFLKKNILRLKVLYSFTDLLSNIETTLNF